MDVHTQQTMSQQFRPTVSANVNEALCLEVVGILKRCFLQQASVKTTLYKGKGNDSGQWRNVYERSLVRIARVAHWSTGTCGVLATTATSRVQYLRKSVTNVAGLFAAINANSQLCTLVLDVLLDHFNQYVEKDTETLPPLSFDKIVVVRAGNVTLNVRVHSYANFCSPSRVFSYVFVHNTNKLVGTDRRAGTVDSRHIDKNRTCGCGSRYWKREM